MCERIAHGESASGYLARSDLEAEFEEFLRQKYACVRVRGTVGMRFCLSERSPRKELQFGGSSSR